MPVFSVKALSFVLLLLIAFLISGLYSGAKDSTKLKIGVMFEEETELTDAIFRALLRNEIVMPIKMNKDEGILAVTESRIQGYFVFKEEMEDEFLEGNVEETVDLYLLDENFFALSANRYCWVRNDRRDCNHQGCKLYGRGIRRLRIRFDRSRSEA